MNGGAGAGLITGKIGMQNKFFDINKMNTPEESKKQQTGL